MLTSKKFATKFKDLLFTPPDFEWNGTTYKIQYNLCTIHFANGTECLKKSSSNSQKFQCKTCKKMTNVLPTKRECTTYHQQRNDILPIIAKHITNKTPITRTCEILEIGRSTYYQKLEWLYRCCLEFLEKHEKKALENMSFKEIWLNTDKMNYNLNNVRKKGQGEKFEDIEDTQFPTSIVVTADVHSRYVFRSDVAYDWDATFGDIALNTILYKEDHLNEFARKNGRFGKFSAFPSRHLVMIHKPNPSMKMT